MPSVTIVYLRSNWPSVSCIPAARLALRWLTTEPAHSGRFSKRNNIILSNINHSQYSKLDRPHEPLFIPLRPDDDDDDDGVNRSLS